MRTIKNRVVSSMFALLFIVGCIFVPASATNELDLGLLFNGEESNLTFILCDADGNPIAAPFALPWEGSGSITMPSGSIIYVADSTSSGYFNLQSGLWVSFTARLSSSAGFDFGYELQNGSKYWGYYGNPASSHSSDFRLADGGNMKFMIRNSSASATTLTYLKIS